MLQGQNENYEALKHPTLYRAIQRSPINVRGHFEISRKMVNFKPNRIQ